MVSAIIRIDHPLFRATILRQGAQLIEWTPAGMTPVLWSSNISCYQEGKAFRGGIPICWPWFGKAKSPAHGFARLMRWDLVKRDDSDNGVHLEFQLRDTPQTREIWPHPFTLVLQMHLGTTCEVRLHIDTPVPTTGALHTYLYTSDITHSFITGLGDCYRDSLQEHTLITTEEFTLQIRGEVDRIYTHPHSENTLATPEKTIRLTHQGHSDVVVWNPWQETSVAIADMNRNDYRHMVCIETARITTPLTSNSSLSLTIATSYPPLKTKSNV
ncbi:MAG: D-hexose-6-phosphate mutarotase [Sulfuricurvum sp.]|nr:D-hexose-6-phosphate mutarotase [Sulfuricurvum sp.]